MSHNHSHSGHQHPELPSKHIVKYSQSKDYVDLMFLSHTQKKYIFYCIFEE